jgi:hypothetical protein
MYTRAEYEYATANSDCRLPQRGTRTRSGTGELGLDQSGPLPQRHHTLQYDRTSASSKKKVTPW